jgi:hypothetical protein
MILTRQANVVVGDCLDSEFFQPLGDCLTVVHSLLLYSILSSNTILGQNNRSSGEVDNLSRIKQSNQYCRCLAHHAILSSVAL